MVYGRSHYIDWQKLDKGCLFERESRHNNNKLWVDCERKMLRNTCLQNKHPAKMLKN